MGTPKETVKAHEAEGSRMTRVVSRDGTEIAYWTSDGGGPPLLLVHGTACDHSRFAPLLPYLQPHATIHAMDRRGRGASGDAADYDPAREFQDVAAVVDAIADTSGSSVAVYGHSYGGYCAFGAATLTSNIRRLVLYEGWAPVKPALLELPTEVEERLDALRDTGDQEAVLVTFMREVVKVPEEEIRARRAQPSWPASVAAAHTITRETRAASGTDTAFDREKAARITVPVLLVTGAESTAAIRDDPETVAAALPEARIVVIDGQHHLADVLAPEVFAEPVVAFLRDES